MLAIFHQLLGTILVIVGIILFPLPIPFGLLFIVIGLALLAPYLLPIQNLVRTIRRKSTKIDQQLIKWRPKFPPIIQKTIDKTHP